MAEHFCRLVQPGVAERGGLRGPAALCQRQPRRPVRDDRVEFGAVRHPAGVGRVPRVAGEVGPAQHVQGQPPPLPVVGRAEHERLPVRRPVRAVRCDRGRADSVGLQVDPGVAGDVEGVAHPFRHGVEEADRDRGPLPRALPDEQGGEHAGQGVHPGADVGDGDAGLGRRSGAAGDRAGPGLRLGEQVVGTRARVRAALAVAGDAHDDQPGVGGPQLCGAEAEAGGGARRQVLHYHVGARREARQRLAAQGVLEVESHRLLVPVGPDEIGAHPVDHVVVAAGEVAAGAVLHLDDPGAEVAQVAGADRRGDGLLDRDDGDATQGEQRLSLNSHHEAVRDNHHPRRPDPETSARAMMSRWMSLVPSPIAISGASR